MYGRLSGPDIGPYRPRVRRDLEVVARGDVRRALAPSRTPSKS